MRIHAKLLAVAMVFSGLIFVSTTMASMTCSCLGQAQEFPDLPSSYAQKVGAGTVGDPCIPFYQETEKTYGGCCTLRPSQAYLKANPTSKACGANVTTSTVPYESDATCTVYMNGVVGAMERLSILLDLAEPTCNLTIPSNSCAAHYIEQQKTLSLAWYLYVGCMEASGQTVPNIVSPIETGPINF
jgi:hypothetical protein